MPRTSVKVKAESGKLEVKKAKVSEKETVKPKKDGLSIPVYSLEGGASGEMVLPKEIFGSKVNKVLLAQAMRVYTTNESAHFGNTKTRSEVRGTTAKAYKQKGTGNARHGARTAPIFVGGGVSFGPKYRKTVLVLPKKMREAALVSALSAKAKRGEVVGVAGLEKASGKTKDMANFLKKVKVRSALVLSDKSNENALRAVRNIESVDVTGVTQVNAYEVLKHASLVLTKEAVEKLQSRLSGEKKND